MASAFLPALESLLRSSVAAAAPLLQIAEPLLQLSVTSLGVTAFALISVWQILRLRRQLEQIHVEKQSLSKFLDDHRQAESELAFRCEWLSALLEGESPLRVITRCQKQSEPSPFAVTLQIGEKDTNVQECVGISRELAEQIIASSNLGGLRHSRSLGPQELRRSEFVQLPPLLLKSLTRLYLFPLPPNGHLKQLLLLSPLPTITADEARDRQLIESLTSHIPDGINREAATRDDEIRLVKQMLELRALTDLQFASPLEMVTHFLHKLAEACGFERGSLYLTDEVDGRPAPDIFAEGGPSMDPVEHLAWTRLESDVLSQHRNAREAVFLHPRAHDDARRKLPFHSVLLLPLKLGGGLLGQLCLTGTIKKPRPASVDLQLAGWGAEYLVETMIRTLDRVVVEEQARRDPLTQLANRRAFDDVLKQSIRQSLSGGDCCALILLDLDHFKQINDNYGHLAGDTVLQRVAQLVKSISSSRVTDRPLVARYGGEELAVLIPGMSESGAIRIAEAICEAVRNTTIRHAGKEIRVTISGGVAVCPKHGVAAEELVAAADIALYRAKRHGRDRIELADETRLAARA